MRKYCLFLLAACSGLPAAAQDADTVYPSELIYGILSQGFDLMVLHNPGRVFNLAFLYTSSNLQGTQTFTGSLQGTYHPQVPMFDLVDVGVGYRQSTFSLSAGVYRTLSDDYAAYMHGGYDYTIPLRWFAIRPGVDLVGLFAKSEDMGSIDNSNQTIGLLGVQSGPTFEVTTTDDDGNTVTNDYDTDHLDIEYRRSSLDIGPRVTFTAQPVGRVVLFSLQAGWLLPLVQNSRIRIDQVATDGTPNTLLQVPQHANGAVGGVYAGFRIGILLGRKNSYRS